MFDWVRQSNDWCSIGFDCRTVRLDTSGIGELGGRGVNSAPWCASKCALKWNKHTVDRQIRWERACYCGFFESIFQALSNLLSVSLRPNATQETLLFANKVFAEWILPGKQKILNLLEVINIGNVIYYNVTLRSEQFASRSFHDWRTDRWNLRGAKQSRKPFYIVVFCFQRGISDFSCVRFYF